jgi:hypothetical protein
MSRQCTVNGKPTSGTRGEAKIVALEAKFTEQIVFQHTEEAATELQEMCNAIGVSRSEIVRRCVDAGLPTIRQEVQQEVQNKRRKQARGAAA